MTAPAGVAPLEYGRPQLTDQLGVHWEETLTTAYRWMILSRALDQRMLALQRQGRVGFYGAVTGQEAVNVAAGLASAPTDWVSPGLREQLVALIRGHSLVSYVQHLFATAEDPALGRQMPCHPTAREVQYLSMSSVIGTQISHAVGIGYALRYRKAPGVSFAFFGDGATSSNDFHAALNLAGVLALPVLFVCTNNQWAISVPVERQSRIPHLAQKSAAYGLPGETVDGTDFVATMSALSLARRRVESGEGPRMLELVIYRMTPHSSSDDPTRYQRPDWVEEARTHDPVHRLEELLRRLGLLDAAKEAQIQHEAETQVRQAVEIAEAVPAPPAESLLRDVFAPAPSAQGG